MIGWFKCNFSILATYTDSDPGAVRPSCSESVPDEAQTHWQILGGSIARLGDHPTYVV